MQKLYSVGPLVSDVGAGQAWVQTSALSAITTGLLLDQSACYVRSPVRTSAVKQIGHLFCSSATTTVWHVTSAVGWNTAGK